LARVWRDASGHRSPNAGWPEAAMAGALGLALAGPRNYGGITVDDAIMGRGGRRAANAADIRRALALYRVADAILLALAVAASRSCCMAKQAVEVEMRRHVLRQPVESLVNAGLVVVA
jgi:cobalamin biosynthesis protein CobD/CbiB